MAVDMQQGVVGECGCVVRNPQGGTEGHAQETVHSIEILVVTAIIAILASLLLPPLASAKDRAKNMICMNKLRQIGVYTLMYDEDHDGFIPYRSFLTYNNGPTYCPIYPNYILWTHCFGPGATANLDTEMLFRCPFDEEYHQTLASYKITYWTVWHTLKVEGTVRCRLDTPGLVCYSDGHTVAGGTMHPDRRVYALLIEGRGKSIGAPQVRQMSTQSWAGYRKVADQDPGYAR